MRYHADDIGLNPGELIAVEKLLKAGKLQSVSLLANMPETENAVKLLKKYPDVAVHLHFNIVEGRPLSNKNIVSSLLTSKGVFRWWTRQIPRFALRRIREKHVAAELDAQLKRVQSLGVRISGIDTHQHMHAFEPVASVVAATGIPMRSMGCMSCSSKAGKRKLTAVSVAARVTSIMYGKSLLRLPSTWKKSGRRYYMASWEDLTNADLDPKVAELAFHPGTDYDFGFNPFEKN